MEKIKSYVSSILKNHFPWIYKKAVKIYGKHSSLKGEEVVSYGAEHPDCTFYIIRCGYHSLGLMGYYNNVVGHIYYALNNGWIPIVDMKNYRSQYLPINKLGKENAWEYFFDQPCNMNLDDIKRAKNVILSDEMPCEWCSPRAFGKVLVTDSEVSEKIFDITKRYLKINEKTWEMVEKTAAFDVIKRKRVVGVLSRGTDLIGASGHSIQPTTKELIGLVEEKMTEWRCDYIFLASEENFVIDQFKEYFGNEYVLTNSAQRFDHTDGKLLYDVKFDRDNDEYLRGVEYLISICLLSQCCSLISTFVGGSVGAMTMKGCRYENYEIIDKGVYE